MITKIEKQYIWAEAYRPQKIEDVVLPASLKNTFKKFVEQKNLPNLLLTGPAGTGKTTVAMATLNELGCDYVLINGSMKGDMDTLRNEMASFASSFSFSGGRKYIILDEADYLNWKTQPALRNFMEEFADNCGFILTCNYQNKIIPALQSRCAPPIDFSFSKSEKMGLQAQFFTKVLAILKNENIEYDAQVVANVIQKYYPDFRKTLNGLQYYAASGKIDSGILSRLKNISLESLIGFMRAQDFTNVRKWCAENMDQDETPLYRAFYDEASQYFDVAYIPELVLTIADYQYKSAFVVDHEVNFAAFCVTVMVSAQWK